MSKGQCLKTMANQHALGNNASRVLPKLMATSNV